MNTKTRQFPKHTLVYNTTTKESDSYIGIAWEFYHDEEYAKERYTKLQQEGKFPTLRPFSQECDFKQMSASDQYWISRCG